LKLWRRSSTWPPSIRSPVRVRLCPKLYGVKCSEATGGWRRLRTACRRSLLPLLAVLLSLPAVAQAQFPYTTNNGNVSITGYNGPGGAAAIPESINDLPITSIGSSPQDKNSAALMN
jgi:hypothetical protein